MDEAASESSLVFSRLLGNRVIRERELANLMATTLIEDLRNVGVLAYRLVPAISYPREAGCCRLPSFRSTRAIGWSACW